MEGILYKDLKSNPLLSLSKPDTGFTSNPCQSLPCRSAIPAAECSFGTLLLTALGHTTLQYTAVRQSALQLVTTLQLLHSSTLQVELHTAELPAEAACSPPAWLFSAPWQYLPWVAWSRRRIHVLNYRRVALGRIGQIVLIYLALYKRIVKMVPFYNPLYKGMYRIVENNYTSLFIPENIHMFSFNQIFHMVN